MLLSRTGAVVGALALGAALVVSSVPATAGARTGTWRNGMVAGPLGVGYYAGYRPYYHGYRPYYRRHDVGGAVAAGLIGGLALGAIAAGSYGYAYPATYGGYYGPAFYDGPTCYTVRRRSIDAWGRVFITRTQVCE